MQRFDLEVNQASFKDLRCVPATLPPLEPGQIDVAIREFALTANNVTYAAIGKEIGYWRFFPASEDGWGRVPVWGFADVQRSAHPEFAEGERIYGFWPMSSNLIVSPDRVTPASFVDATAHRQALPAVYNHYSRCAADPLHRQETEAMQALFWPLFMTAFMLEDFIEDSGGFGAETVVISSASGKTALGTAYLAAKRGAREVVGLTSAANRAFVASLGCYDRVLAYDELDQLPGQPSIYVDFAGNTALRRRLHEQLGDQLKFSSAVGYSHLGTLSHGERLPGPEPVFFFAPAQISKRERDWKNDGGVAGHLAPAWAAFVSFATLHITIERHDGPEAAEALFKRLVDGDVNPAAGPIVNW